MRFKLRFEIEHQRNTLTIVPFDYQRKLSAWIYETLARADKDYAEWLHNHGYRSAHQFYKYFTFSPLFIPRKKVLPEQGLHVQCNRVSLILSFAASEIEYNFIAGLFQDARLEITNQKGSVHLKVMQVERLPEPVFTEEMDMRTLSPVFVSRPRDNTPNAMGTAEHLSPEHPDYLRIFADNLIKKHRYWNPDAEMSFNDIGMTITSKPRSKVIITKFVNGKPVKNRAFHYAFRLKAPAELIRTGYYAGFGGQNAQGFGCVEVKAES